MFDEPAVGVELLVDGELGRIDEIHPDGSWVVSFTRSVAVLAAQEATQEVALRALAERTT